MTEIGGTPQAEDLYQRTSLRSYRDVMTGELQARGRWIVANVSGALYWPTVTQKAAYRGFDIFITPPTSEGHFPTLAIKMVAGQDDGEARKAIMGFLSALCWINDHAGAWVEAWAGGSSAGGMCGRGSVTLRTHPFELDYLPEPTDPKARLALALCREAAALNQATGQLLSRKDAFIPLNIIVKPSGFDARIARCFEEAAGRRDLSTRVWRGRVPSSHVAYSSVGLPHAAIISEIDIGS